MIHINSRSILIGRDIRIIAQLWKTAYLILWFRCWKRLNLHKVYGSCILKSGKMFITILHKIIIQSSSLFFHSQNHTANKLTYSAKAYWRSKMLTQNSCCIVHISSNQRSHFSTLFSINITLISVTKSRAGLTLLMWHM